MTFLAFRTFQRQKHRNDVIVTSYIKIYHILKLKSKDNTSKTLHAKFYASRIKNKRIRGVNYAPWVWSVFKSPGKIGLNTNLPQPNASINFIHNHPPVHPRGFAPTLGLLHPNFCPGGFVVVARGHLSINDVCHVSNFHYNGRNWRLTTLWGLLVALKFYTFLKEVIQSTLHQAL